MDSKGQSAPALKARPLVVARALLLQTPVLALLVGLPGLGALLESQSMLALSLLLPAAGLFALALWRRNRDPDTDLRRVEAVVTLALLYVLSGLLTFPAFMVLGLPPLDALFEGIAGITTTGLSMSTDPLTWPIAGHFLRAWMQWCGGVVVAVAGVALLSGPGRVSRVMGRESVGETDYHASTRANARVILKGYAGLTAFAMLGALAMIPGWWEGPMLALAAVSTGGFTPRPSSLAEYSRFAQIFILSVCVASSVSLLVYAAAFREGPRAAWQQGTVRLTLTIILASVALQTLYNGAVQGWDSDRLITGALNQVSAQTTAGFSVGPVMSVGPGIVLVIVAMMMGGDVGATTGGIKTARLRTLGAMIALVLLRLRLPDRAVAHVKTDHERVATDQIVFSGALFGTYLLSLLIFWLALMTGGHPPLPSMFDAVSALSGVGLSTEVIGPAMSPSLKIAAMIAMLAGRLEFFALIVLFLPATWSKQR